jgi:alanine racemase
LRAAVTENTRHSGATLTISLAAVRRNYRLLVEKVSPGVECAAVVKADAYGLGAHRVAPALYEAGCRSFFVAHLDEGLDLQRHLPTDVSIYVLNGLPTGGEGDCAEAGLVPVLNSREQAEDWSACARKLGVELPAVVQVDSGMSRLGMSPCEIAQWNGSSNPCMAGLDLKFVMSHLACADVPSHPANAHQLTAFESLAAYFPGVRRSLANSSGIFLGPEFHHDVVRPGAALYGINPLLRLPNPMSPVVKLTAQVIQVREIELEAHVGYGWEFRADKATRLATLSVGYADGLHRVLGQDGAVYFEGRRLAIAGRVSMDTLTVDLGDLPPAALMRGTEIDIIGDDQSIDDLAAACGTIGYEVLTGLGHRYRRNYADEIVMRSPAYCGDTKR